MTKNIPTAAAPAPTSKLHYPPAPMAQNADTHWGTVVADPFRPLENPDSPETIAWVDLENEVTEAFLAGVPERQPMRDRLLRMWDYERPQLPYLEGEHQFYWYNSGAQQHDVLYVADSDGAHARVLLDANTMSPDGSVSIAGSSVSRGGQLLAYGISVAGSDWQEWRVRNVETGDDLPDCLRWVRFSDVSWMKDGSGFFYTRYPEPTGESEGMAALHSQKLYFHRLGTTQDEDVLVYERPDQKYWRYGSYVTEDGDYLIVTVWPSSSGNNRVYYKDLRSGGEMVRLLDQEDANWCIIGNDGPRFWFMTNLSASNYRIVEIDIGQSGENHQTLTDVIPERKEAGVTLVGVSLVGNHFFLFYEKDACRDVEEYGLDGIFIRTVPSPGFGTVFGFAGKRDQMVTYYGFTGYTTPATLFRYDIATGEATLHFRPALGFDTELYTTELAFAHSTDGTRVPLFISYKKGLKRDGQCPTYLHGYGGFGLCLGPGFSSSNILWMDLGGIFAQAIIRGGGEYGEEWRLAGTKMHKPNSFDDFVACAELLISDGYTNPSKLAIAGESNGGMVVGACMTRRPELFGAVIASVGVMDMLRYHLFSAGTNWREEYGYTDESAEMFRVLLSYSPIHNIKQGVHYPATLVKTADHDDRVVPGHSLKFAATLQASQGGEAPCLLCVERKAGHGEGKTRLQEAASITDNFAFLIRVLNMSTSHCEWLRG